MDISSLSPSIRESLLARNIISDTVEDNGLSGLLFDIGNLAGISNGTPNVRPSDNLEEIGDLYKDLLIINNRYQGELSDYQRISIVTTPNQFEDADVYNTSPEPANSPIIQNSELSKEFNALKNKYQGLLQNNTTISLVTYQPTEETFINYDYSLADLGSSEDSKEYRKNITTKNKYLDFEAQILSDIITTPIVTNKNLPNYAERMAGIVGGGASNNASSVIDNLLGGVVPNYSVSGTDPLFDVTSLLGGGRSSDTPETPLGIIGADRLGFAIRQNAAFNLIEETIGNVNTNPISLLQGDSFIVPNYSITVAKGTGGAILDFAERILGFQTPVSLLSTTSSIFSSENPVGNIERGNSMIENTGKGQVEALFFNLRQNLLSSNDMKSGYAPGFVDPRNPNGGINGNIYAFFIGDSVIDIENGPENNPISQSSYKLDGMVKDSGFQTLADKTISVTNDDGSETIPFTWGLESRNFDKKTILGKTQQLFNTDGKMKTMINKTFIQQDKSEVNSAVVDSEGVSYTSRGSNKIKFNGVIPETDPEKMFFRNFNSSRRYDRVNRLQKHSGILDNAGTNTRRNETKSVLDDNGFVKITPYSDDPLFDDDKVPEVKKYMLSLENLAWDGYTQNLIPEEIGNGDPISGKRGRIMWFPPYDVAFTDNTSVNWEKTDFIGRGEPIYTYNNTTRNGTLQFKIIIDHPSYLNMLKGESDQAISSFFAGGFDVDDRVRTRLTAEENRQVEIAENEEISEQNNTPTSVPTDFEVYFPFDSNKIQEVNLDYENSENFNFVTNPNGLDEGVGEYTDINDIIRLDNTNYGLNDPYWEAISDLPDMIKECTGCKVTITTYGVVGEATIARFQRSKPVYKFLVDSNDPNDPLQAKRYILVDGGEISVPLGSTTGTTIPPFTSPNPTSGNRSIKENIKVVVKFQWDAKFAEELNPDKEEPDKEKIEFQLGAGVKSRFFSEYTYFKRLEQEDKFAYNSISEKIGHFHPSFHSITPEGFNSRLTFLQQCTRQGPTNFFTKKDGETITNLNNVSDANKGCNPDNLAFGKPPVCILRVGDFYHTKIVIDSLNYSFDPLVWDLNPEGVGVQPMICTVDINFAFIGGSSLSGPISRLQNAVSYNFFANTEIYSPQSDTLDSSGLVKGEYPTTDYKDKGDSSNTNTPTTNQTTQANTNNGPNTPPPPQNNTPATPPATPTNIDRDAINSAQVRNPRWGDDDSLILTIRDLYLERDPSTDLPTWSIKVEVVTDAGSVQEMNVFEPSQWYGDSGGEVVELVTAITKSNIDSLSITHVWSRTENEAPADQIDINKIYYRVTFFKNGEQSILRDDFRYYYPCNDPSHLNPDGTYDQNEKYDFTIGEYEAGIVSCLCKLNPNYDDPTIPLNYCPF
tara:strand:- start:1964 stop:6109 length:4146 start_codon:yes stop_codon:yes gene_type:complete